MAKNIVRISTETNIIDGENLSEKLLFNTSGMVNKNNSGFLLISFLCEGRR